MVLEEKHPSWWSGRRNCRGFLGSYQPGAVVLVPWEPRAAPGRWSCRRGWVRAARCWQLLSAPAETFSGNSTHGIKEGLEIVRINKKTHKALIGNLVNWQAKPEQNCGGVTAGERIPTCARLGRHGFGILSQLFSALLLRFAAPALPAL